MKVSFFLLLSLGVGGDYATAAASCGSIPCANEEEYGEYVDNHAAFSRRHKKEEDGVTFDRRDFAYCNRLGGRAESVRMTIGCECSKELGGATTKTLRHVS